MKTNRVLRTDRTNVKMCVIVKTRFFVVLPLIHNQNEKNSAHYHCVKSDQIRSYFWCVFSYIRIEYRDLTRSYFWSVFSPNKGKYGPEITPYFDTFHAVYSWDIYQENPTQSLAKFHGVLFESEIVEIFTTSFLLKAVI